MATNNFSCSCGSGIGSLGVPSCVKQFGLSYRDIFVNTYDFAGNRNGIPVSAFVNGVLPESYLLSFFDASDTSYRWSITPDKYEEVAPSRTERQTQESATGTIKVLRKGVDTFEGQLWNVPKFFSENINKANCNEISVYKIDEAGNVAGEVSADGSMFYPLLIEKGSLNAESFDATPTTGAYTRITYQLSRLVNEGNYLTISRGQLGADLRTARSLIEVDLKLVSTTATEVVVDASNGNFGNFASPFKVVGADLITDWLVRDATTNANIALTSVDDVIDGRYKLTFASTPTTAVFVYFKKTRTSIASLGLIADPLAVTTGA